MVFFLVVAALTFFFPRAMRWGFHVPFIGSIFGGFFWAMGLIFGWASLSFSSLIGHLILGCFAATFIV